MRKSSKENSYSWTSASGTEHIIIPGKDGVTEADIVILCDLDRLDDNDARRNRRHTISLEVFIDNPDKADILMDTETNVEQSVVDKLDNILMRKVLQDSMRELSPQQVRLLEQVYMEELSLREIARREGVTDRAIRKRLLVIMKKFKKSFG